MFDIFYVGVFHCLDFLFSKMYMWNTYNLTVGPVQMLVTCHLLWYIVGVHKTFMISSQYIFYLHIYYETTILTLYVTVLVYFHTP